MKQNNEGEKTMQQKLQQAGALLKKVKTYWGHPMPGRYMPFREIAAYAGGGIGAYFVMCLGMACILGTGNTLVMSTLGVAPTDLYIMYVIAVVASIPMTGLRADIIDNTRNKAGKYRPYILTMGVPTALLCVAMVWFPYNLFERWFPTGTLFGKPTAYVLKCAVILIINLFLHFFYYFFYDAYENLIHVLSPDSQERSDVASIKSVVYSMAPSIVNLVTPLVASNIFHSNATDIRVYRLLYPILSILGLLLCIVVYSNTQEKIVQARTHVVQIKFTDALRAVAKNKYFWIISLAGWIGFLETAYSNILFWLYNYGGACSGNLYGIIVTIYGNASLWGMLITPFAIRKWGKKAVLIVTNLFNILFILLMLPATRQIDGMTIWLVLGCLYMNAFVGSFFLILNPAVQADIRDYQQYITGERIDGMFSAVGTIGIVITLSTSSILPMIYEKGGLTAENAARVTSNPAILSRLLGDGKTVGTILQEQLASGQNNYINANSALYDPDVLLRLLHVLILFSAFGALLNVIPYFWYDFSERKQKSVIRVLKIRAMFEDYHNGLMQDDALCEAAEIIRTARAHAEAEAKPLSRKVWRGEKDKAARKAAKAAYKRDRDFNEEIEIGKFVCAELDKFGTDKMQMQLAQSERMAAQGLQGVQTLDPQTVRTRMREAKAMPKTTKAEKELRSLCVDQARTLRSARKAYHKYFAGKQPFVQPDFAVLEGYFAAEDDCDDKLKEQYAALRDAKKAKDRKQQKALRRQIKETGQQRKQARADAKAEMDRHAFFARAAKPVLDAEKLLSQRDMYAHLDEIMAKADALEQAKEQVPAE